MQALVRRIVVIASLLLTASCIYEDDPAYTLNDTAWSVEGAPEKLIIKFGPSTFNLKFMCGGVSGVYKKNLNYIDFNGEKTSFQSCNPVRKKELENYLKKIEESKFVIINTNSIELYGEDSMSLKLNILL